MAFISTQKVAEIRSTLKKEFPEIKFSVRRDGHTSVKITILKSPYDFRPQTMKSVTVLDVNTYWIENIGYGHAQILNRINEIAHIGNHNNSRPEIDYFDVGWYVTVSLGQFNKPFEVIS